MTRLISRVRVLACPLWFIALDTVRRKRTLCGRARETASSAIAHVERDHEALVLEAAVLGHGVRLLLQAKSLPVVRTFVKRLSLNLALVLRHTLTRWRACAEISTVARRDLQGLRSVMQGWSSMASDGDTSGAGPRPRHLKSAARYIRVIEHANATLLGADEAASRVRRYTAAHETPRDDRHAFSKLCEALFAQGLGFEVVAKHWPALEAAFFSFHPKAVAEIDEDRIRRLLDAPIIRNRKKIVACIENAKRWVELAGEGSYLARVAALAGEDSAAEGWPDLVDALEHDFIRLREPTARVVLKRWGFFTARSHAGAQRVLERLGIVQPGVPGPRAQIIIGRIAQTMGTDPYAIEASLALFAAHGPCRELPRCEACALNEDCLHARK